MLDYTLPHVDQANGQMAVTHLKAFGCNSYRQPFATTKAHFVMRAQNIFHEKPPTFLTLKKTKTSAYYLMD